MTQRVEDSDFAIHNRKEIIFILEDLAKHRPALNLDAHNGSSLLTAVLKVDAEDGVVYLDVSGDNRINEKVVTSDHVTFSTQTGVRVRWHADDIELVKLPDGDAFSISLPDAIERIQRREYFRLNTPQGAKALICKIPVSETETLSVPVVDMSVGGIGLSLRGAVPPNFSQGAILEGCSIEFPVVGPVPLNLKVCGVFGSNKTRSGDELHHIGLEFMNLSRGAGNVVQRYMIQLESERISLS
jgi:c-di-GMP-binding flagellar brake protein YcgR